MRDKVWNYPYRGVSTGWGFQEATIDHLKLIHKTTFNSQYEITLNRLNAIY